MNKIPPAISPKDIIEWNARLSVITDFNQIGAGANGQVFRCWEVKDGSRVRQLAAKFVTANTRDSETETRAARMLRICQCPLLSMVETILEWPGYVVLIQEYYSVCLLDILEARKYKGLPLKSIQWLIAQLVVALADLQANRFVHYDLKPENIVLMSYHDLEVIEEVKPWIRVIDFGLCEAFGGSTRTYLQTRFYRAPETILGLHYEGAADCWGLGCIAAELYLGLPLFPGEDDLDQMQMYLNLTQNYDSPPLPNWMIEHGHNSFRYFAPKFATKSSSFTISDSELNNEKHHPCNCPICPDVVALEGGDPQKDPPEREYRFVPHRIRRSQTSSSNNNHPPSKLRYTFRAPSRESSFFLIDSFENLLKAIPTSKNPIPLKPRKEDPLLKKIFGNFLKNTFIIDPTKRPSAQILKSHPFVEQQVQEIERTMALSPP